MRRRLGVELRRALDHDACRSAAQHLDGQSRFGQDSVVAAVGIEIEHPLTEAKPCGESHHDVGVGAGLADGRDDRWPELDMP